MRLTSSIKTQSLPGSHSKAVTQHLEMFGALLCQKEFWSWRKKVSICVIAKVHSSTDAPESKQQPGMGSGFPLAFLSVWIKQTTAWLLRRQAEIADWSQKEKAAALESDIIKPMRKWVFFKMWPQIVIYQHITMWNNVCHVVLKKFNIHLEITKRKLNHRK